MNEPVDETKLREAVIAALDEAITKADGPSALASRIGCKSSSTPLNWRSRGSVPAEWCPAIERETGVPCERLCPGVDWAVLRAQAANAGEQRS